MVETQKMRCPDCGTEMNHHADKIDCSGEPEVVDLKLGGVLQEVHSCPECGTTAVRIGR